LRRGFEVWSFDWRGQGFSSRQVQISEKQRHDIDTFDTYLSDVTFFIDRSLASERLKGKDIAGALHGRTNGVALSPQR